MTIRPPWRSATALLLATSACAPTGGEGVVESFCRLAQAITILPPEVRESSGVAISTREPGVLWTHNDSGGEPVLYALDTAGRLIGQVTIDGVENVDWEDLSAGPCPAGECFYIGDIGDNHRRRREIVVHRVPEPSAADSRISAVESFPMRYPDGAHDAEALFILPPDRIHVVTKGGEGPVAIYRYPGPLRSEVVELERVRILAPGPTSPFDQVTGADASRDGERVVIRTYRSLRIYRTAELLEGSASLPISVDLEALGEAQGEAVALGPNDSVVLTSEAMSDILPGTMSILRCTFLSPSTATP